MEENKKIEKTENQEMDKVAGGKLSRKAKIGLGAGLGAASLAVGSGIYLKKRKGKNKATAGTGTDAAPLVIEGAVIPAKNAVSTATETGTDAADTSTVSKSLTWDFPDEHITTPDSDTTPTLTHQWINTVV